MKKIASALLAATLAGTMMTGCIPQKASGGQSNVPSNAASELSAESFHAEGLPIVDEKITYDIAAKSRHNKNFANLEFFQKLEEQTNVHVEWNMSSDDGWKEKKGLLFAGELPDAFYGQAILTDVDVVKYASQGLLIPLDDLIDQYAPNIKRLLDEHEDYRKALTAPDGHIYSLPNLTELSPKTHDKLFINKTWLDQLNLPMPETLDDFEKTLIAFRDNDMNGNGDKNDEIPFSFLYNRKENGLFSLFGSFGQVDNLDHMIVKDGEVVYTAMTEPYKEAIQYFNKLYNEKLIDNEGFTHDFNVYIAKVKAPEKTVGSFVGWSLTSAAGPNKDDYVAMPPLKGKDGKQIWNTYPSPINSKGSFAITNKAKNPEVLMRWVDLQYEPETSLQIDQGLLGKTLEKGEDGRYSYLPVPDGKSFAEMIHEFSPGVNGVGAVTMEVASKLNLNANLAERAELDKFYAPYNVPAEEVFPQVFFTMDEVEKIASLETDIKAYVDQCYADWIVHGGVEEDWDGYLKKLDQMHVQEYVKIYSDAYHRFMNS